MAALNTLIILSFVDFNMDNSVQNLHKKKHISKQYDVFKIHHKPKEIFQSSISHMRACFSVLWLDFNDGNFFQTMRW